jgi:hypothetical protein
MMFCLVDSIRDSVSRVVLDLGKDSFTDGLNWSSYNWSSNGGISEWGVVGEGLMGNDWRGDGRIGQSRDSVVVVVGGNGWDRVREWGSNNTTLLTSSASLGFSDSGEMLDLGSMDLRSILNWSWARENGYWSLGKSVAFSTESTVSSDVVDSDFITVWVDVSVASTDIAIGVSEGSMSLSWLGMTVRSLT